MAAVPRQNTVWTVAVCLLALAAGASACTPGYFKLDLLSTTDSNDLLARCLTSVQVNLYNNCTVSLLPLNAAGSLVPAVWTGNAAASFINYVQCPIKEGTLIAPVGSSAPAVQQAIVKAFEGHVYGFDTSGASPVAKNPTKLSSTVPIVYNIGSVTVTRAAGVQLLYAVTERTVGDSDVDGNLTVLANCTDLPFPASQCRDDSDTQGLGTACPNGTTGVVVNDLVKACSLCPPGSTGDGYGCTPCAAGTAGGLGQTAGTGYECANPCGAGYHAPTGISHCLPCPTNTYSNGSKNKLCTNCAPSSYAWVPGSTACLRCVKGVPEACTGTNGTCPSGNPPSPGSHIVEVGQMNCSLSGPYELRAHTKCTSWAQTNATTRVQLALVVSGDCSIAVLPVADPACADPTNATGYDYGTVQMQAYYATTTTIRSLLNPADPSGPMLSITDSGTADALNITFWAGTLDYARANDSDITGGVKCSPASARVIGGQVATQPDTAISQCPAGSYAVVDSWPQGSYADNGSYCYPCPVGSRCPGSTTTNDGPVAKCQPNEYNPYLGAVACLTCNLTVPLGETPMTSYAGAASCDVPYVDKDCYTGGVGKEYDPVSQLCQLCPAGKYRNDTLKKCVDCSAGEFSGPGAAVCTKCPAGQFSPSPGLPDQQNITGITGRRCLLCPRGSLALSGNQTAATVGTGQIVSGATFCDACPAGFVQDAANPLKPCVACKDTDPVTGPYTYRTGDATPENNECVRIPAGYKLKPENTTVLNGTQVVVNNTQIMMCEEGRVSFWSANGTRTPQDQFSCIGCADLAPTSQWSHTYAPHAGMIACIPCPAGTVPVSNGTAGNKTTASCATCPDGYYRDTYTESAMCLKCPAGKEAGFMKQRDCTLCKPGFYMTTDMATANQNFCSPCPKHQFRATPGGATCDPCPRGSDTQDIGNVDCTDCPLGFYNNKPGTACDPAPAGTYVNTTGSWMYKNCPRGTWNDGTAEDSCMACAAGRYSPTEGSKECKVCPPGTFSTAQSAGCTDCRAGYSSPPGSSTCNACKPGTYAPNPRSQFCLPCPKGYRCPNNAMRKVMPCPKGTYSSREGNKQCTPCPVNSVSSGGGTAANPLAIIACSKCALGTSTRGLTGQTRCSQIRPQVRKLRRSAL